VQTSLFDPVEQDIHRCRVIRCGHHVRRAVAVVCTLYRKGGLRLADPRQLTCQHLPQHGTHFEECELDARRTAIDRENV
jgi:hypothetical protein